MPNLESAHAMGAWAVQLSDCDCLPNLRREFRKPKHELYADLERSGLPAPRFVSIPLSEFISTPKSYLERFGARKMYVIVEQGEQALATEGMLDAVAVAAFARRTAAGASPHAMITIIEELEIAYDGVALVDEQGMLYAEFIGWRGRALTRGLDNPEFVIRQDPFSATFRYSFSDMNLRRTFFEALRVIPRQPGDNLRPHYVPGYYEIQIARVGAISELSAVVHDVRTMQKIDALPPLPHLAESKRKNGAFDGH